MGLQSRPDPGSKWTTNCIKRTNADVRLRTPDDGQKGCPKHVVVIPIKLEFSASVGFIHKEFKMFFLPFTYQIQPVQHIDYNTSPKLCIRTDHITVLVTNPQTQNNFNSPDL
jgi:hypothetical protein